jgi:hypothetical protein
MRTDSYTKIVLTAIAALLAVIACHSLTQPKPVVAGVSSSDLYIEPGVYSLRAADGSRVLLGKMAVDLRTGKIWGFPTGTNSPYPLLLNGSSDLPVSRPFLLGKFDLESLDR